MTNLEIKNQVMDNEGQIGIKVDYSLRPKRGNSKLWYTTKEELQKGWNGEYMKIWARDGFETIGKPEHYTVIQDRHIVWTGQYL